ncbi:MAG: hypothetical protein IJ859_05875 [Synergistaceae bacterium]|nr:hypothetical protein [Synergistaceae bacterium]
MLKKLILLALIWGLALPCVSFAAAPINNNTTAYNYTNTDPFHLSAESFDLNQTTLSPQYTTNGLGDIDFFYQVRDVTGETNYDAKNVGGPQWFATVYEKYSTVFNNADNNNNAPNNNNNNLANTRNYIYRRTLGGQLDDVPVSVIGDILDGFNFVFAEEPEPYEAFLNVVNNNENYNVISNYYDRYPDPLETLCVITTDGIAKFNVNFANPYARHFPFWWNWYGNNGATPYSWWQSTYNWRDILATYTVEPVAYIYNPSDGKIYSRESVYSQFSTAYATSTSGDLVYIDDLSGNHIYVTSGDVSSSSFLICSSDVVYYLVSGDNIYSSSGGLAYTLESAWNDSYVYVCSPRTVKESILIQGLDDYEYQITVNPTAETDVNSAEYLNTTINIRGDSAPYGSRLAYITFRQRASFMPGYENFREASPIPFVFANVSKGNAADNPLIFDLTIFDGDRVVKRMKFKWDAQSNLPNQDLGTFFIMKQAFNEGNGNRPNNNNSDVVTTTTSYNIEARITNRTGTRYMLYRYDRANAADGVRSYTLPKYWKFDLTEDTYGTLPKRFLLDSHSQIAPGLVTVYDEELDITKNTTALDSFRLYEYNYANPKDLWLNYKRVGGIYVDGDPTPIYDHLLTDTTPVVAAAAASDDYDYILGDVQTFIMDFVDIKNDENNTESEIKALTGKTPVLPSAEELLLLPAYPRYEYISSSALDSFKISYINLSSDIFYSFADVYSVVESEDTDNTDTNQDTDENSTENQDVSVTVSAVSSDKMAVIPMSIRLKIPRKSQLLKDIWEELDSTEDSRELFRIFNKYGTVRVRSSATSERDADLFKAVTGKGANLGVSAEDCVSAFLYEDYLYLDFMVFAADAVSKNTGKTAFVEIFEDDGVPYILVGDGSVDGEVTLSFYVDVPLEPISSASNQNSSNIKSSGSGSTCNITASGIFALLLAIFALRKLKLA